MTYVLVNQRNSFPKRQAGVFVVVVVVVVLFFTSSEMSTNMVCLILIRCWKY